MAQLSRAEEEAAKEDRKKDCVHCGHKFSISEAFSYIAITAKEHMRCDACFEKNFLWEPRRKAMLRSVKLMAFLAGLVFFLLINGIIWMAGYISYLGIGAGLFGGAAIGRTLIRSYMWIYGEPNAKDPLFHD